MSSLMQSLLSPAGLMGHRLRTWTRTRTTEGAPDPDTGKPTRTTTTASVTGHFRWLSTNEAQDFRSDPAAALVTAPDQLRAGDRIASADLGEFLVLEEGPYRAGEFDRVPLRRA